MPINTPLATIKIHAGINLLNVISIPIINTTRNIDSQSRDFWPGSTSAGDLTTLHLQGYKAFFLRGFQAIFAGANWRFDVNYNPGFIPYESALDLDGFTRNPDGSITGGSSWFNGFQAQTSTLRHDQVSADSKNQIMTWLNSNRNNPYLGTPSNLFHTENSIDHVKIHFTDEAIFETGTLVERRTSGTQFQQIMILAPNATSFTDCGLQPNTMYEYRLFSMNNTTKSLYSGTYTFTTPVKSTIGAVQNLVATPNQSAINLSWNTLPNAVSYKLYRSINGACPVFRTEVTTNSFIDEEVLFGFTYTYQVLAKDSQGKEGDIASKQTSLFHFGTYQSDGFTNTGQRKVLTIGTHTYLVYTSLNKIWLERTENNGTSWIVCNGGVPISTGNSKSPSFVSLGSTILIALQEETEGGYYCIKLKLYDIYLNQVVDSAVVRNNSVDLFSEEATPIVVAYAPNQAFAVIYHDLMTEEFSGGSGLYYESGYLEPTGNTYRIEDIFYGPDNYIPNTDMKSIYPAVSVRPGGSANILHLVWQQGTPNDSYCDIIYQPGSISGNSITFSGANEVVSAGCGFTWNHSPSVVNVTVDDIARICWIGQRSNDETDYELEKQGENNQIGGVNLISRVVFRASDNAASWTFGDNVIQTNINGLTSNVGYAIGWSQLISSGFQNKVMKNTNFYQEFALTSTGQQIQINNSPTFSQMFATSLTGSNPPFMFNNSQTFSSLSKETLTGTVASRSGILHKGKSEIAFSFGNIIVNDQAIYFPLVEDTVSIVGIHKLNEYLISNSFQLTDQSTLTYSVKYGILDTVATLQDLEEGDDITFRLALEDAISGEILGLFDQIIYNRNNLNRHANIGYEVNTNGIGTREVRFRLIVETNTSMNTALNTKVSDISLLPKVDIKHIDLFGRQSVIEYALSQNYPNPFNPVTEIEFALPEQSDITLKVYDILGKEIATLASGSYSAGRYTVPFDGTSHASGVYIYKLSYGKGQSITRKMTMLK